MLKLFGDGWGQRSDFLLLLGHLSILIQCRVGSRPSWASSLWTVWPLTKGPYGSILWWMRCNEECEGDHSNVRGCGRHWWVLVTHTSNPRELGRHWQIHTTGGNVNTYHSSMENQQAYSSWPHPPVSGCGWQLQTLCPRTTECVIFLGSLRGFCLHSRHIKDWKS